MGDVQKMTAFPVDLVQLETIASPYAEYMVDYCTCLEICFLRISQFFENHLTKDRWHADLLEKMTLRIEGVRDPVLTDATSAGLAELMKFRHFRRYYYEMDYDWDKLEYLQKVFARVESTVPAELEAFQLFLGQRMKDVEEDRLHIQVNKAKKTMKTANIAEFKNHVSQYLRVVKSGEPVQICKRNQSIAVISPVEKVGKNHTKLGRGKGSACIKTDLTAPVFDQADWDMLKA